MGPVAFTCPCPPLQAPRLCPHGSQEGRGSHVITFELALSCTRRRNALGLQAGLRGVLEDAPVNGGLLLAAPRRFPRPPSAGHRPKPCNAPLIVPCLR